MISFSDTHIPIGQVAKTCSTIRKPPHLLYIIIQFHLASGGTVLYFLHKLVFSVQESTDTGLEQS